MSKFSKYQRHWCNYLFIVRQQCYHCIIPGAQDYPLFCIPFKEKEKQYLHHLDLTKQMIWDCFSRSGLCSALLCGQRMRSADYLNILNDQLLSPDSTGRWSMRWSEPWPDWESLRCAGEGFTHVWLLEKNQCNSGCQWTLLKFIKMTSLQMLAVIKVKAGATKYLWLFGQIVCFSISVILK